MINIQNLEMVIAGRRILKVDSLRIAHGEKVAILGRNGAGKSTLLRCLNGFAKPTAGRIQVNQRQVFPLRRESELRAVRAEVGQVLQGLHLVGRLSAMENVLVGGLARMPAFRSWARIFTTEEKRCAQNALAAVGMAHLADKRADRLSGGERQKVAIARMLMQQPQLVLADEPTAALDPTAADEVCELLVKASEKATLITVVHNVGLVPLLSHRVIGLKEGEVVLDCASEQLTLQQLDDLYE